MRNPLIYCLSLLLFSIGAMVSCSNTDENSIKIRGKLLVGGRTDVFLQYKPIHYKFAEKVKYPILTDDSGNFEITVPKKDEILWLHVGSDNTPLFPNKASELTIAQKTASDQILQIDGYSDLEHDVFNAYAIEDGALQKELSAQKKYAKEGKHKEYLSVAKTRVTLAKNLLAGSEFQDIVYKRVGEYLDARFYVLNLKKDDFPQPQVALWREKIFREAEEMGFFTFASLKAQRAGIRDFNEGWSMTFPFVDSVQAQFSKPLSIYDKKRLAFSKLDSVKLDVIDRIKDKEVRNYALMYLMAERIGEGDFQFAVKELDKYREELNKVPEYTAFLDNLKSEIGRLQPGNPAFDFEFIDAKGQEFQLSDFEGKYVLIDFWAQWCGPCLEEFSEMTYLYGAFDRDQFEIVAINIDESKSDWEYTLERFDLPWIQVFGGKGFDNELFKLYRGASIPMYVLIDPDGNILRYNDVTPSFNLEKILMEHLEPKTASVK